MDETDEGGAISGRRAACPLPARCSELHGCDAQRFFMPPHSVIFLKAKNRAMKRSLLFYFYFWLNKKSINIKHF
ncbi:hypothetical protein [Ralstonia solanacearum]|uniref:Uncharacterized protein n=1 Tax=Ralstonia solanacearum (strain Po82) TaxID=1031711 RepID=F6G6T3_RALS8|nr:hypothetical protein [Ralstonia solanacearum]AEG67628.1 hypothetical protein RSPO_c00324 [Ralstonia solanacearum Po82]MBB6586134.1 hypothetical protein [Ralstonia solanacearum]MCG3576697.1 hypothetical protein [Ralstonia solanacearum]MCL9827342.1 hypothetical protein [Ralstonia solanacearum]MCL9832132.1 hypothetical protein [Ralstonia solanacearum]